MNEYIAYYFNSTLSGGTPEAFFSLMILGLCRLLPIVMQAPFFGSRTLPMPVKICLGISLFVIFFPTMLMNLSGPLTFNTRFILLAFKELFIGFAIGWVMSAPFMIVQSVGMIVDHQRGGASLMVNDPSVQTQSSPLGTLFNLVLINVFYFIDGPFYLLDGINTSYAILPPDRALGVHFFDASSTFWQIQFKMLNSIMVMVVQMGAPALITILMTDMFLGIANRLAPQVQITFLGLPLKSLLALLVIWMGWKAYNEQTIVLVFQWFNTMTDAIFSLGVK